MAEGVVFDLGYTPHDGPRLGRSGARRAQGSLQVKLSEFLVALNDYTKAIDDYDTLIAELQDQVDLIEMKHAVDAAKIRIKNAERNEIDNVRVVGPDEVPADVRFTTIWSNPPIRIGKAALHELMRRWLPRLTDDGCAVLVVQKHLGADSLQRWLVSEGFECDRLTSRAGFRLLEVRPQRGRA